MSSGNIELVLRGYELFNAGDEDRLLELFHPEVEWSTYLVPGPGGATYCGREGVRELWRDVRAVFRPFRNEPEQLFEFGDRVVAYVRFWGRGRESGVEVDASLAHVMTVRDGLIARVQTYEDREEAVRAAKFP